MNETTTTKIRTFSAIIKGMNVLRVGAVDEKQAIERITEQLDRPGRYEILSAWISDGKKIQEKQQ